MVLCVAYNDNDAANKVWPCQYLRQINVQRLMQK